MSRDQLAFPGCPVARRSRQEPVTIAAFRDDDDTSVLTHRIMFSDVESTLAGFPRCGWNLRILVTYPQGSQMEKDGNMLVRSPSCQTLKAGGLIWQIATHNPFTTTISVSTQTQPSLAIDSNMSGPMQEPSYTEPYTFTRICSPASVNVIKNNQFLKAFGHGPRNVSSSSGHSLEDQSSAGTSRPGSSAATNDDDNSFLNFQAHRDTGSPFQAPVTATGTPSLPGWAPEFEFTQPLSPPDSALRPYHNWQLSNQSSTPGNILANMQHEKSYREQYGQVTPPEDDDIESLLDDQLRQQAAHGEKERSTTAISKAHPEDTVAKSRADQQCPPKRTRKYTSRKVKSNQDSDNPPNERRSKFLERNRVAASKCRQKKKEWTQKLETRARDLQKDNSSLNIMIESLSEEVSVLKTQCAEHGSCECYDIQQIMEDGPERPRSFWKDPVGPSSNLSQSHAVNVATTSSLANQSSEDEGNAKNIANNENTFQALLTSSIENNKSEKGIANRVSG